MSKRPPSRHLDFFALMEAVGRPGCPVCRLTRQAARRWLETLFYEQVNDPATRERLRQALGFCARHASLAARLGDPLGWSIIAADLLGRAQQSPAEAPVTRCPVCEHEERTARHALATLLAHLEEPDVRAAYEQSEGLCLPHLRQALTGRRRTGKQLLEEIELKKLAELRGECEGFVEGSDYRQRQRLRGPEADAWRRAARKLSGLFEEEGGKHAT